MPCRPIIAQSFRWEGVDHFVPAQRVSSQPSLSTVRRTRPCVQEAPHTLCLNAIISPCFNISMGVYQDLLHSFLCTSRAVKRRTNDLTEECGTRWTLLGQNVARTSGSDDRLPPLTLLRTITEHTKCQARVFGGTGK
jgi:hypothetical protein